MSKENCCGKGCNGCNTAEKILSGYINIYDMGGLYQAMSAIYDTEDRAMETGKITKGYIGTVFIQLPKGDI